MNPVEIQKLSIPAHDQAAGVILCIASRLFKSADLAHATPHNNEAFKAWRTLRSVADHFIVRRTLWIPPQSEDSVAQALNLAHSREHARWELGAVAPIERCRCVTAVYIRELAKIRGERFPAEVQA